MALIERILRGVHDQQPVAPHAERSPALKAFLVSYEEQTVVDVTLPVLTHLTSGRELKDAFDMLEPGVQLEMLTVYWRAIHGGSVETVAAENEREQMRWVVKYGLIFIAAVTVLIAGMIIALASKSGKFENPVTNGILSTAGEILKVIIGTSK